MEISFIIFQILKSWWWFFLPIILWFPAKFFYLWWIRWEVWYPKFKWILLEIKPPKEVLKPFSAMENIFSILWGIINIPNWRERWCEGVLVLGGGLWFSFEIASFGGEIHFFMRIPDFFRNSAEAAIYSQYSEAEISLVEDYTKKVPKNVPNKNWDLYGEDFNLIKDDCYPIKTYLMFFEERPETLKEEKRLDPMDSLLEDMSKLKSDEQFWLQIVTNPILDTLIPWETKGREIADRIAKRPPPTKPKPMWQEAVEILISGKPAEEKKEKPLELIAPELRLTPGEKEILTGIENKIKKYSYQTWIRIVYLYQKDKPFFLGRHNIGRSYFNQFMTGNLNTILYMGPTRTRIHYWLKDRRLYLRKRKQFRNYVERLPPYFPWNFEGKPVFPQIPPFYPMGPGSGKGTFVLNIEELATIFHIPAKIMVPTVPRVEAKKAGPPPGLPAEIKEEIPPKEEMLPPRE